MSAPRRKQLMPLPALSCLALLSMAGAVGPGELCQIKMNPIKDRNQANCTRLGLSRVPSQLPKDTGILLLGCNHLVSVSTSSFQYLPMLVDLDLSHNGLKAFHAVPALPRLQELVLSHNALGALPSLQGLPALLHLGLAHNSIQDLAPGAFRSLGELQELDLRGNQLRRLPKEAFAGLAVLRNLDLSNNPREELPLGLLSELEALEVLRLLGNCLPFQRIGSFPILAYLRDWITENEASIYYQEDGLEKVMVENDAESVRCDSPAQYRGTPVLYFTQSCRKADIDPSTTTL
ncbi:platelet glycoprotein Ib alpha chain-like [Alligator sinensis]|uniref:Platelet glycoprotein Ib alpha chain-like n=1 Tax=Alligator sinensis TaxID=38654 RepID=A0A1U8DS77_ALLSI|nr:platelet glycoprotein Ib alpha chain-like [Alligator sinensis]